MHKGARTHHRVQSATGPGQGYAPCWPASHPDTQSVHASTMTLPGTEYLLLLGHTEHRSAPGPLYVPMGHLTAVAEVLPAGHVYPAEQLPVQVDTFMTVVDPKDPAGQGVQAPAAAREYVPAAHQTDVAETLPAGHANPAVQLPEQVDVFKPVVDPKEPAGQGVHTEAPASEYVPALHFTVVELVLPAAHA